MSAERLPFTFEQMESALQWGVITDDYGTRMTKGKVTLWRVSHNRYVLMTSHGASDDFRLCVAMAIAKEKKSL
jgi:hypothetical protein